MFRPVDQRFLQIVYDFAVHPDDEDFHTEFAQDHCAARAKQLLAPAPGTSRQTKGSHGLKNILKRCCTRLDAVDYRVLVGS
jgi:hypothetical protein